jgi:hypothetical protein
MRSKPLRSCNIDPSRLRRSAFQETAQQAFADALPTVHRLPAKVRIDPVRNTSTPRGARLDKPDPSSWSGGPGPQACIRPEPAPPGGYGPPLFARDVRDPLVSRLAPEHYRSRTPSAPLLPPDADALARVDAALLARASNPDRVRAKLAALRALRA